MPQRSVDDPRRHPDVILRGARVWSDGQDLGERDVLVADGRIAAIEPAGTVRARNGSQTIDAAGDVLLPGLIDAHVHLYEPGVPAPEDLVDDPRSNLFPITCRQMLRSGVTTARVHVFDLVHGPQLARDADHNSFPSPRLQLANRLFSGTHRDDDDEFHWAFKGADDARPKLARSHEAGAKWVALHDLASFDEAEGRALVEHAHELGIRVMAQGDHVAAVAIALDFGVDTIEYLDLSPADRYPEDLLIRAKEADPVPFFVAPVGFHHRLRAFHRDLSLLDDPLLTDFMPTDLAESTLSRLRTGLSKPLPDWTPSEERFAVFQEKFRQLRASGVPMAVGSDAGSAANFQIDAIWWELRTWCELGASADQALTAATAVGARLLKEPDIGRVEVGSRADLVLFRGDLDGGSLGVERVRTVMKGGVVHVDEGVWVGP